MDPKDPDKYVVEYPEIKCPLGRIPPEIRLQIYEYVAPKNLLSVPSSQYYGLLLSCKWIHAEVNGDVVNAMRKLLKSLQESTRCRVTLPDVSSFQRDMSRYRELVISVLKPRYRSEYRTFDLQPLSEILRTLLPLRLRRLTLTFHDPPIPDRTTTTNDAGFTYQLHMEVLCLLQHGLADTRNNVVQCNRIEINYGEDPNRQNISNRWFFDYTSLDNGQDQQRWHVVVAHREDIVPKACWQRYAVPNFRVRPELDDGRMDRQLDIYREEYAHCDGFLPSCISM